MPIRLTPQSLTVENKLWTAEVTPPEGGGHPWWSPGPMTVGDLIAALRAAGCSQADIDKALREANADYAQAFRDADAEKKYGPAVNAALSGDYEPPSGTPFTEPMVAYVLFFDKKPESLAELLDTFDYIERGLPRPDELAWALLRLKRRGWLVVQKKLYGLTDEGRETIQSVVGAGETWDQMGRLKEWMAG